MSPAGADGPAFNGPNVSPSASGARLGENQALLPSHSRVPYLTLCLALLIFKMGVNNGASTE